MKLRKTATERDGELFLIDGRAQFRDECSLRLKIYLGRKSATTFVTLKRATNLT